MLAAGSSFGLEMLALVTDWVSRTFLAVAALVQPLLQGMQQWSWHR